MSWSLELRLASHSAHCTGGATSLVPKHPAASVWDQFDPGRGVWGGAHCGALCSGSAAGCFVYAVAKLNGTYLPWRISLQLLTFHQGGKPAPITQLVGRGFKSPYARWWDFLQERQDAVGSSCWCILPSLHSFPLELVRRYISNPVYHLTASSESSNSLVRSSLC